MSMLGRVQHHGILRAVAAACKLVRQPHPAADADCHFRMQVVTAVSEAFNNIVPRHATADGIIEMNIKRAAASRSSSDRDSFDQFETDLARCPNRSRIIEADDQLSAWSAQRAADEATPTATPRDVTDRGHHPNRMGPARRGA
jgi:hypothetical protein